MDESILKDIESQMRREELHYIREREQVYVLYSHATGKAYPAIDCNGFANVCTKPEYAEQVIAKNDHADLDVQAMTVPEFDSYVRTWYRLGVVKFRLNHGIDDHTMEVNRDDYLPDQKAKMWDYAGSSLNFYTIRYRQNLALSDGACQASAKTLWSMIAHVLPKSLLLAPFVYAGEPKAAAEADNLVHVTAEAQKALRKLFLEKKTAAGDDAGQGVLLLYGDENYRFPDDAEEDSGKQKRICTLTNRGEILLPVFTDFQALERVFGRGTRVGLFTYEELCAETARFQNPDGTPAAGLVLNPGDTTLILSQDDLATIEQEKREGFKLYLDLSKPQSPSAKQPQAAAPEEAVPTIPLSIPVYEEQPPTPVKPADTPPVHPPKTRAPNAFSIVSLVLGITSLFAFGILVPLEVLAVVFGVIGFRQEPSGKTTGAWLAVIGIVLGLIAGLGAVIAWPGLLSGVLYLAGMAAALVGLLWKK